MFGLEWGWRRSVPVFQQTEAAECGLACLGMVAAYYGYDSDLPTLRRRFAISLRGVNLRQLIGMAHGLNLGSRPLKADLDQLPQLRLPAVLHWDLNHFVVLTRIAGQRYHVNDPARGKVILSREEFSKHYTGIALELTPNEEFQAKSEKQTIKLWSLWGSTRGLTGALAQIMVLALALELVSIVAPMYQQVVIDQAVVAADHDILIVLAAGFALLLLIQVAITAARSWALLYLGTVLSIQMSNNLFRHLLRLPMDYFEKRSLGDIASRFNSLEVIRRTITTSFLAAIIDGVMMLGTLVLMCIYSVKLAAITLVAVLLYAILRWAFYRPLRQCSEDALVRGAKQNSNFLESVRGVQCIKLFGREDLRQSLYENLMVDRTNADIKNGRLQILYALFNTAIFGLENIVVIYFAADLVLGGTFSVGMMFAYVSYKLQFQTRAASLIDKGIELLMLGLHGERLADVALTKRERRGQGKASEAPQSSNAAIELRNVSFAYNEQEEPVFKSISLAIQPGESVAIVGPSGCGKSTLLKIMLGLLTPTTGDVLIFGRNTRLMAPETYRNLMSTVMQDDTLFAGSIADNIAFFESPADPRKIVGAARLAAIHNDIMKMPMQYNTLIGDMGNSLSGGQRQRVILARALYRKPRILLLDEATSAIDVRQERYIVAMLGKLRTTIVSVAHRPETVAAASRIINLGPQPEPGRTFVQPAAAAPVAPDGAATAAAVVPVAPPTVGGAVRPEGEAPPAAPAPSAAPAAAPIEAEVILPTVFREEEEEELEPSPPVLHDEAEPIIPSVFRDVADDAPPGAGHARGPVLEPEVEPVTEIRHS